VSHIASSHHRIVAHKAGRGFQENSLRLPSLKIYQNFPTTGHIEASSKPYRPLRSPAAARLCGKQARRRHAKIMAA
jgi:hypothetical protein